MIKIEKKLKTFSGGIDSFIISQECDDEIYNVGFLAINGRSNKLTFYSLEETPCSLDVEEIEDILNFMKKEILNGRFES